MVGELRSAIVGRLSEDDDAKRRVGIVDLDLQQS
jgi:hypothetical protein